MSGVKKHVLLKDLIVRQKLCYKIRKRKMRFFTSSYIYQICITKFIKQKSKDIAFAIFVISKLQNDQHIFKLRIIFNNWFMRLFNIDSQAIFGFHHDCFIIMIDDNMNTNQSND